MILALACHGGSGGCRPRLAGAPVPRQQDTDDQTTRQRRAAAQARGETAKSDLDIPALEFAAPVDVETEAAGSVERTHTPDREEIRPDAEITSRQLL